MGKLLLKMLAFAGTYASVFGAADNAALEAKMDKIFALSVQRYYSPATNQFYGRDPATTPSPEDIKKFLPLKKNGVTNWHGGGSGMEDNSLFNGVVLAALCDKYEVAKDETVTETARKLSKGLRLNATGHGDSGFVARGVSPVDQKTVYWGTSIDQYTNFIYGQWRFARSPMATDADRREIAKIFVDIAEKMLREAKPDAVPPNSFKFYKGFPDDRGTGKVVFDKPTEASMRLVMFYAAAYDATKNKKYFALYRKYLPAAIEGSLQYGENGPQAKYKGQVPAYTIPQMAYALDLVYNVETDAAYRAQLLKAIEGFAKQAVEHKFYKLTDGNIAKTSPRDVSEIFIGEFMNPNVKLSAEREKYFRDNVSRLNGYYAGSNYMTLGAYWLARKRGLFPIQK